MRKDVGSDLYMAWPAKILASEKSCGGCARVSIVDVHVVYMAL